MLRTLAIENYRSLHCLVVPLAPLTVVTGANGVGKSNLYGALRLLVSAARGDAVTCYHREASHNRYDVVRKNLKSMVSAGTINKECAEKARLLAYYAEVEDGKWLRKTNKRIQAHQEIELEKIDAGSIWKAFKKK